MCADNRNISRRLFWCKSTKRDPKRNAFAWGEKYDRLNSSSRNNEVFLIGLRDPVCVTKSNQSVFTISNPAAFGRGVWFPVE